MAQIVENAPLNDITKALEGPYRWLPDRLTYSFAKADDSQEDNVASYFDRLPPYKLIGQFNALEPDNATDKPFVDDVQDALKAFSRVANINVDLSPTFIDADLKFAGINGMQRQDNNNAVFGSGALPGEEQKDLEGDYESYLLLNTTNVWATNPFEEGGENYRGWTILHELGHTLGLAHPFLEGERDVTTANKWVPDDPLDNARYTIESYTENGFDPNTAGLSYGHSTTPMALDIAALQNMYGPTELHSGNTTYRLTDPASAELDVDGEDGDGTVSIGRAFYCIWDTGGADTIAYEGASRVLINLNDATLSRSMDPANQAWIDTLKTATVDGKAVFDSLPKELRDDLDNPAYHAGGFFSRLFKDTEAQPQLGGYSIAKGAEIENAEGGSGNDVLIGNEGSNTLIGGAGADGITGGGGIDKMNGGRGEDSLSGGTGNDLYIFDVNSADGSIPVSSEIDTISERGTAEDIDGILINAAGFKDLPMVEDHFDFYATGNDLEIVFDLDNDGTEEGSVVIKDMNDSASRIETLSLFGEASVRQLDLVKLYEKLTVENSLADLPPPPAVPAPPSAPPPSAEESAPEPVDVTLKDLPPPPPVPAPPSAPPPSAEESAPEPPASDTVQDLGGEKPSGDDTTEEEKFAFDDLPPPPDVPPPPPPSFSPGSAPEPDARSEAPSSDTVQDLGGNEPTVPDMESNPPPALDDMLLT